MSLTALRRASPEAELEFPEQTHPTAWCACLRYARHWPEAASITRFRERVSPSQCVILPHSDLLTEFNYQAPTVEIRPHCALDLLPKRVRACVQFTYPRPSADNLIILRVSRTQSLLIANPTKDGYLLCGTATSGA